MVVVQPAICSLGRPTSFEQVRCKVIVIITEYLLFVLGNQLPIYLNPHLEITNACIALHVSGR
jgi:hypothetical protein